MGFSHYDKKPIQHVLQWGTALLAGTFLVGCQISPRRIVTVNPSPTASVSPTPTGAFPTPTPFPSPTVFPTPTPFPSPTPIPTATPMAMATPAASANAVTEFLYTADPGPSTITAYRINGDGTLSPAQDSLFVAPEAPQKLLALGGNLLAAGRTTLTVYAADKETAVLRETDSVVLSAVEDFVVDNSSSLVYAAASGEIFAYRLRDGKLEPVAGSPFRFSATAPSGTELSGVSLALDTSRNILEIGVRIMAPRPGPATMVGVMRRNSDGSLEPSMGGTAAAPPANHLVLDATGEFAYRVDTDSAEIFAYRVEAGRLISLWPASYPAGEHPVSLAVVAPP